MKDDEVREGLPSGLPAPSAEAAAAYAAASRLLRAHVDEAMSETPERRALVGTNPLRVMFDHHRNHAGFMENVLRYQRFGLLASTIPWEYRAYLNQGFHPDYFAVSQTAWVDAIEHHLAPEHAAAIVPIYRWMQEQHEHWRRQASAEPPTLLCGDPTWDASRTAFYDALVAGDGRAACDVAVAAVDDVASLEEFFGEVVSPAMHEIGRRWELGHLSPAVEHRATAVAVRALMALQLSLPAGEPDGPRVLVGASPNEHHELGAQMLALILEKRGWQVSYLGADTPARDVVGLALTEQPMAIVLSVSMLYNVQRAQELIEAIHREGRLADCQILLGGRAFADFPELAEAVGGAASVAGLSDGVALLSSWADDAA